MKRGREKDREESLNVERREIYENVEEKWSKEDRDRKEVVDIETSELRRERHGIRKTKRQKTGDTRL